MIHNIATNFQPNSLCFEHKDDFATKIKKFNSFLEEDDLTPVDDIIFKVHGNKNSLIVYTDSKYDYKIGELINQYIYNFDNQHNVLGNIRKYEVIYDWIVIELVAILKNVANERGWSYWTGQKS